MAKRMLADVLWNAANRRLWDGTDYEPRDGTKWSCNAALCEEMGARYFYEYLQGDLHLHRASSKTNQLLESLGASSSDPGSIVVGQDHPQGVRYMWLLLAMHVAEDEGLTA